MKCIMTDENISKKPRKPLRFVGGALTLVLIDWLSGHICKAILICTEMSIMYKDSFIIIIIIIK